MKSVKFFKVTGIEKQVFENVQDAVKAVQNAYTTFQGYPERVFQYDVTEYQIDENGFITTTIVKTDYTDYAIECFKQYIQKFKEWIKEYQNDIEKIKKSTRYKNENNRQKAIKEKFEMIEYYKEMIKEYQAKIAD